MTTALDFPSSLPKPSIGTLKSSLQETYVEDASGVGSPRRRARYTRALERFSFTIAVSEAQRVAMDAFYKDTLLNGVLSFNWAHPLSGTSYEVRFSGRPEATMAQGHRYTLAVVLEEI
ncbi:MAG: hypothetical protein V7703_14885 [Hyphomicrobiales bacterium]